MANTRYNKPDYICAKCWVGMHKKCQVRFWVLGGLQQECLCRRCKLLRAAEEKLKQLVMVD